MRIAIDEVVHFDVITSHPTTGAATDADSTPTFDVYEEATDTGLLGATNFTKRTSLTGNYRGSFTASAANGFEAGKWYDVIASATVNSVAGKAVAMHFVAVPAEAIAGLAKVDVGGWLGTAAATPTVAGVPEVDVTHWIGTACATPTVAGVPEVDMTHLVGVAQSATDLKDFADTGYDPSVHYIAGIVDAGGINQLADLNNPTIAATAAGVWDALVAGITTVNSIGKRIIDYLTGDIFARVGAPAGASVSADIAAVKADTAAILVDTGTTLDGRIPAALTAGGNMKSDALAINGSTASATRLALSTGIAIIPGTVDHTGAASTTTEFEADDITEATADHFNGRIIVFTSGAMLGQATSISDYALVGGRGHFTCVALTEAPADNVTFLIV